MNKLSDMNLYEMTIFNWNGCDLGNAFEGKMCIGLREKSSNALHYLTDTLEISVAGKWYTSDVIATMLTKLSKIKFCQCCGQVIS